MATIALKSPGDDIDFQMTWDGLGAANLVSVVHAAPAGLTKVGEATNPDDATSTIRLSGGAHGKTYQILGVATLDTGRTLERAFTLRLVKGAS